ncbi:hypothetical protein [Absidia glauca]|uniref:Uncharacterized protein n=1 Tax=Absidia glauca TaxID=4829 RepID=A0A163ISP7_ABSGL|nr:hypothetical protein [Absidia glauca]
MADARNKKLKEEAAQGYCLKEVQVFSSDVKDAHWKCPFCEKYTMVLPSKQDAHDAWRQAKAIMDTHMNAHRSVLLHLAPLKTLQKYEKRVTEGSRRARIWVSGSMNDRGIY